MLACIGLFLVGCGSSGSCAEGQVSCDGECIPAIELTLAGDQGIWKSVFDVSCNTESCHDDVQPEEMLDLSSVEASEMSLIDVISVQAGPRLRVEPGDSGASYLMNKLEGVGIAPGTTRMPQLDLDGLCSVKIEAVRAWIDSGAN